MSEMDRNIINEIEDAIEVHTLLESCASDISKAAEMFIDAYRNGKKSILFGNGGSAADAQHIAAELVGRFKAERRSLPSIALTTNTSVLTAIGNDYSYEMIFSRQIESFCTKGDVVVGISTSGKSRNVLNGLERALQMYAHTIALTGEAGLSEKIAELEIRVPSHNTQRIQECHILVGHIISGLVEDALFSVK